MARILNEVRETVHAKIVPIRKSEANVEKKKTKVEKTLVEKNKK